ncbi:MAG: hypothetical protein IJP23_00610 [Oscillospiraceae bacterium]|nr:hypothetical protein [Oscillospiraceae bacterium]
MPKKGMKRPERTHTKPRNDLPPVPEIQGRPKSGKEKAKPINSAAYPVIDTDLARDNIENDLPAADLEDL